MFEFNVSKSMKKKNYDKRRIRAHLLAYLLTQIVKKLKISVEQGRVVTTLNTIKHQISYLVYLSCAFTLTSTQSQANIHV